MTKYKPWRKQERPPPHTHTRAHKKNIKILPSCPRWLCKWILVIHILSDDYTVATKFSQMTGPKPTPSTDRFVYSVWWWRLARACGHEVCTWTARGADDATRSSLWATSPIRNSPTTSSASTPRRAVTSWRRRFSNLSITSTIIITTTLIGSSSVTTTLTSSWRIYASSCPTKIQTRRCSLANISVTRNA